MLEHATIDRWIESYLKAWKSNAAEDIAALFTEEAEYYTEPFRRPWTGRQAIVSGWLGRPDDPGTWSFRYEILGISGERAFVRGWTDYREPQRQYSNLWVIDFAAGGRASSFTEWWMQKP